MSKIGFALLSNSRDPIPSTRIACLNLFPRLREAGFEPEILFEPAAASEMPDVTGLVERVLARGCKIVVFQKIHGWSVLQAVTRLRNAGVRTIYCVCDWVDNEMAAAVDATIVVTEFLKSLYRADLHDRIHVIHDGIERADLVQESTHFAAAAARRATLRAILVTSHELYAIPVLGVPPRGWRIDVVGRFAPGALRIDLISAGWRAMAKPRSLDEKLAILRALLHLRIRRIAWHPDGVYDRLLEGDVGIIPIDTSHDGPEPSAVPAWKVKSENRLTLMMAIGLPVIASRIPSYEQVIEHGVNGFLADSRDDWLEYLSRLRDADLRREMGFKARHSALKRYSLDLQADLFLDVLRSTSTRTMAYTCSSL
jgi:glycosyltransferase involved in cell wall biosynthesis